MAAPSANLNCEDFSMFQVNFNEIFNLCDRVTGWCQSGSLWLGSSGVVSCISGVTLLVTVMRVRSEKWLHVEEVHYFSRINNFNTVVLGFGAF